MSESESEIRMHFAKERKRGNRGTQCVVCVHSLDAFEERFEERELTDE